MISRCGATFFARGGKEGKTPLEPAVQDSLISMCEAILKSD